MSEQDLRQLRQVLRRAVRAAGLKNRELEHRLGIGSGNIYRMLDGTLDLRVRHLLELADLLEIPPSDLLELGCPDAVSRAKRRLGDVIGQASNLPAQPTAASLSLDQLNERIRNAVQEALQQQTRRSRR